MKKKDLYKQQIAKSLNGEPQQVFLYWKGRVALYAILKAIGVKPGDEVILPALTCVVVPNAIIYAGANPVYVDINPTNYNFDVEEVENAITPKTKAIICQNTFGLSANLDEIVDLAKRNSIFTIEDCAHGYGGTYNGRPNGTTCDASFFSTQWNKPFSTGLGGFAFIRNPILLNELTRLESEKVKPHFKERLLLWVELLAHKYLLNDYTYWFALKTFRLLSSLDLVVGSSSSSELESTSIPREFFKDASTFQVNYGLSGLTTFDEVLSLRKKNAEQYTKLLKGLNKAYVDSSFFNDHSFLKYPLLTSNRENLNKKASKEKVRLSDWFISPLHPVKDNLENWGFEKDKLPIAVDLASKLVNLPTETKKLSKVLKFIIKNKDLII